MLIDGERAPSYSPTFKNPEQYIEAKLKILTDPRAFGIQPTYAEREHLKTLKTQTAIDNAIISIIWNRWGD